MKSNKDSDCSEKSNQLASGTNIHAVERNSGIELLKIVAIFLVITSHVVQTLSSNDLVEHQIDLSMATTNLQQFILIILRYSGAFGNNIFFICSAWFLLDSKKSNRKKWWFMLLEIWSVSIIMLIIYIIQSHSISAKLLIKSLLPTTFSLNWYMTCYLLFYLIYPALNEIISHMSQTVLLKTASLLLFMYVGINFIHGGHFFPSALILWIAIYFAIAYIKLYLKDFSSSTGANLILLFASLAVHIILILMTNILGLNTNYFSDKLLHWNSNNNPFLILAAICLLNLARKISWKNSVVNHISKLSMLINIIHENLIIRTYYRPYLINYVYESFSYENIVFWVFIMVFAIFLLSLCASLLYEYTLQRLVKPASEKLCESFDILSQKYEKLVLKLH